jgi:KDO2-lipid IV(A) lauroyltransferase
LQSYLVYAVARVTLALFRILPRALSVFALNFLATLTFYLDARHRRIARVNLKIAFPELSHREHDRIARKSFCNSARNLLEVSRLARLTKDSIAALVTYDHDFGLNNFETARSKGKGILYLTGHFSSWELLPTAHALHGYPLSFLTRPLDIAPLERYMLRVREAAGNRVISKKNSARQILQTLKAGASVGILMDQNTSLQEGIFADFFGLPAATTSSVALFALRTQAPVLPGYLTPMRNGRYTIKFLPPIEPLRTGEMGRDIELNTRLFNEALERIIREQPESWLWGHRRWKNQPPGHPDLYSLSPSELEAFLAKHQKRQPAVSCRQ